MKTANGAAVLQKALQFANDDNSVAGEAAKKFAEIYAGYIERKQFDSGDFDDDIISFLAIEPEQLDEIPDEAITKFIEGCHKKNALRFVKRFCQICVAPWFDVTKVSYEKLIHIGSVTAKVGLKEESARIFGRATDKALAEEVDKNTAEK